MPVLIASLASMAPFLNGLPEYLASQAHLPTWPPCLPDLPGLPSLPGLPGLPSSLVSLASLAPWPPLLPPSLPPSFVPPYNLMCLVAALLRYVTLCHPAQNIIAGR